MSSPAQLSSAAINLAIETTMNALSVEKENGKIRDQLKENQQILNDFDAAIPRARNLQNKLKEKEALIEQKRKELVELQTSIIATMLKQDQQPQQQEMTAEFIPTVMNQVQKLINDITESAVDQKTLAVPILSLFKVSSAINKLYDTLASSNVIDETNEEKEARIRDFISTQQNILLKLRAIAEGARDDNANEDDVQVQQNPVAASEDEVVAVLPAPEEEPQQQETQAATEQTEQQQQPEPTPSPEQEQPQSTEQQPEQPPQ